MARDQARSELGVRRRKQFGLAVRRLRNQAGYSQEAFAMKTGLHRTHMGAIERGEQNVSLENIWQIADGLGTTPAELFGSSGDAANSYSL